MALIPVTIYSNLTTAETVFVQDLALRASYDADNVALVGQGFTVLTPTGPVDGSNVTFVFTQAPTLINADGIVFPRLDNNGNAMWTIVGTTVTMPNPPMYILNGIV